MDGSAGLAIHQISEAFPVVGPLPAEAQLCTPSAGALAPNGGKAARGFLARLSGEAGRAKGMAPPG